jgi:polyhydroxybutyrate depolymerase
MKKVNRCVVLALRAVACLGLLGPISLGVLYASDPPPDPDCNPSGDYDLTIHSGGLDRPLILHVPGSYDGHKPLPLVLVLHGFGGTAAVMTERTRMSCKAETEGFFVAYLNGTKCDAALGDPGCHEGHEGQGWNSGLTPSLGITVDDVQFVRDVVASLEAQLRVDDRRVYAAGFSNGAFMTHRLAAELPDLLAAVALAEGTIGIGDLTIPEAVGSIPILIMHGTADTTVTYDGHAEGLCPCKSVDESVAYWLEHDLCRGPSRAWTDGTITTTTYAGCFANNDVVLNSIAGGEHNWPSIGTDAAWSFFSKHSRTAQ